ncbi:MAG: hypothetical protein CSB24_00255 [Deltaproteobacteria bacterium]|nr:MAG: hypothetical protein CSB24_00255 [Deltaproteobacteria bacterium]
MEQTSFLAADTRNGNLHITLSGSFDEQKAREVGRCIHKEYVGEGNVFINTSGITEVKPRSRNAFNGVIEEFALPEDRIYFKGEKGRDICHDHGRVIVAKSGKHKHCSGRCKNCKCRNQTH